MQQAAEAAARHGSPSGLGLDSSAVRECMALKLQADGVDDVRVLQALASVPRHLFVDTALAGQAYEDTSLPIGLGQTISKPSVVGRMLCLALQGANAQALGHLGRVLEVGTGCGYQAALLLLISQQVVSVERLRGLHDKAREHLEPWRGQRLRLVHGDGRLGHGPLAPFDTIIAAAGGEDIPAAWMQQLAVGGRIVAPKHDAGRGGQRLCIVDRSEHGVTMTEAESVHFVPLKSGTL
jgi:protein-L-isoaspartate(D-aspartate) O-methyltransferase